MRCCVYCGKELEKGEVCDCIASVERRNAAPNKDGGKENPNTVNDQTENASKASSGEDRKSVFEDTDTGRQKKNTRHTYKTGYPGGDNRFERARDKFKAKRAAKKNHTAGREKGFIARLWELVVMFIKKPADAIANPQNIGMGEMFIISAFQGALLWLCVFFVIRRGAVGPLALLSSMLSFGGIEGYRLIYSIGICLLSGALGGIVLFLLYSGIFYFINRIILRQETRYRIFCVRLVLAWIPFTLICAVGAVFSFLSPMTLAALLLCGAAVTAVLTYEALRTEWISLSPSKVLYAMLLGYFVFFSIVIHLITIN